MIKASELRIGNLLLTSTDTVTPIRGAGIAAIESGQLKMSAISLTAEWLERMGFAEGYRDKIGKCWTIDIMPSAKRVFGLCNLSPRTLVSYVAEDGFPPVMLQPVFDVHQLQNLYFALTGEELVIKQPVS